MFCFLSYLGFSLSAPAHLLLSLCSFSPFIGLICSLSPPDYTHLFALPFLHTSLCIYCSLLVCLFAGFLHWFFVAAPISMLHFSASWSVSLLLRPILHQCFLALFQVFLY
ncbi:hypothetical protein ILYODFUR_027506 [Ilyodon furcidens]|uniref:NADH dehydrogenase subunit 6 n=1 Tax=Ilyodon furcidens TaxID=33524 RepID=A0ABV0U9A5_9TELE